MARSHFFADDEAEQLKSIGLDINADGNGVIYTVEQENNGGSWLGFGTIIPPSK
jgi:hypothetical protein